MSKPNDKKTPLNRIEDALKWFWRKNSGVKTMKCKNAEFFVEPRVFIGDEVNPEIARLIVSRYLARVTPEDVINKKVVILEDKIIINDDDGKQILEVKSRQLIDKMANRLTNMVGQELSGRMDKEGVPYLKSELEDEFSFGDIKESLIRFIADAGKHDSKNLMKDAVMLINSGDGFRELVSPSKDQASK